MNEILLVFGIESKVMHCTEWFMYNQDKLEWYFCYLIISGEIINDFMSEQRIVLTPAYQYSNISYLISYIETLSVENC